MILLPIFAVFASLVASSQANINLIDVGVTCSDIKTVVDRHNELRRSIAKGNVTGQPKANNMQAMVWDTSLANMAQAWANNGQFKHSSERYDGRFPVGENLYIYKTTNFHERDYCWSCAVDSWFDEYKDYTYIPLVADPKTGHYTQVVWADTIYVGCGASTYDDGDGWLSMLYVCNYGPTGNYLGEYPYEIGSGCEDLCCIDPDYDCGQKYGDSCF